jgi:hypothetical protein
VSEHHFNTYEQVCVYLRGALEAVNDLELSDDLRPIAFTKAIELLAAKQVALDAAAFAPPILTATPSPPRGGNLGH